jgi:hypothetical protein
MTASPLSPADDLLVHQVAEPVRWVGTSDRNFYDRHYFNMNDRSNDLILNFGLAAYPNLGVMDAYTSIRQGADQFILRSSKELGVDRLDTRVGPQRMEVIEGLRRLRWIVDSDEHELHLDVVYEGLADPHFEVPRMRRDANGRISNQLARYNQVGCWSGTLSFEGRTWDIDPEIWNGVRDRSWGIRPVGAPEPERAQLVDYPGLGPGKDTSAAAKQAENHFWLWAPMLFEDRAFTLIYEERGGRRTMLDAGYAPRGGGEWTPLGPPQHDIEWIPGTRMLRRARFTIPDVDGTDIVIDAEPLQHFWTLLGSGYGQSDVFRHGKHMGPLYVDSVRYDHDDPATTAGVGPLFDASARFTWGDKVGYGELSYGVFGAYPRYGFMTPEDMA